MAKANKKAAQAAPAPAPAAAETPTETPAQKKLTTYAELLLLKVAELATYCKKIVRVDQAIEKAKEAFAKNLKFNSKVVAALKRLHAEKRDAKEIPGDWTFKDYFKNVAGGELPGRVEALAALFNSLVLTVDASGKPLLSEENFDAAADDWLEKANPIIKQAQKQHGEAWKTCDDVLDVVNALSKPGDALKAIKQIRARQKGEQGEGEGEEGNATAAQPLTVGRAIEFLKAAMLTGATLIASGKKDEVFALFAETFHLHDNWEKSGIPAAALDAWTGQLLGNAEKGVAPHMEVRTETPSAAPEPAAALAS
jgi:hypothetical protein